MQTNSVQCLIFKGYMVYSDENNSTRALNCFLNSLILTFLAENINIWLTILSNKFLLDLHKYFNIQNLTG